MPISLRLLAGRRRATAAACESSIPMKAAEIRSTFLKFFESKGHTVVAVEPGRAGRRPDAAVHQRRDEPVQGRLPRLRQAPLRARRDGAEVHPRRRQAQRPRERRLHRAPPHLLRDAGQLQLRRLLQEGRAEVRLGAADRGLQAARPTSSGRPSTPRTTRPTTSGRTRSACRPSGSCASATTRARATPPTTSG